MQVAQAAGLDRLAALPFAAKVAITLRVMKPDIGLSNSMDPDRSDGFCNADFFDTTLPIGK
jgi:hypothetical protein